MVFVPQLIDQMVDRAGHLGLGVEIVILAEQRQRFSVESHLDIGKSASACDTDLVWAAHLDLAGTRQQQFLVVLGDNLKIGIVIE